MTRPGVYVALVHHPVRGRGGETITSSVTNLDIHDIARVSRSYSVSRYFIVTPIEAQKDLVAHILGYWHQGPGGGKVPERAEALSIVAVAPSLPSAVDTITGIEGTAPEQWTTAARSTAQSVAWPEATQRLRTRTRPVLLVFGTAYGLADGVLASADLRLAPVRPGGYNHLAVRSAVAIILDRLLGDEGD